MQIGVAGLVFALVQILFSAECKILSICTSEKQVFTCTSGTILRMVLSPNKPERDPTNAAKQPRTKHFLHTDVHKIGFRLTNSQIDELLTIDEPKALHHG